MTTRITALPAAAGDIERQLNGQLYAVNGGRSRESVVDREKAQLFWITDVLQQFDRKELREVIDYSVEHPKPADYYPTSANNWTNWGQTVVTQKG